MNLGPKPHKYLDFKNMKVGQKIKIFHYGSAWTNAEILRITVNEVGEKTLHYKSISHNAGGYGGYKETVSNGSGSVTEYYECPVTWAADKFIKPIVGEYTQEKAWIVYDGDVFMWQVKTSRGHVYYGGESDTPEQCEKSFQNRDEMIASGDSVMI